jgi:serine/threonine protein kinase
MSLAGGTRLGPYEILSLLGSGGMGEVYRARDPRLDREVAIKVLPADRMSEDRRRRFVREARAASALNHPNIVTIHEIDRADGQDFIVMEYVAGRSLDQLIPRQGMQLRETLRIAIPIADALARAHDRGIVHRDLKPANVMVGDEGTVKLLDFGLAKLVEPTARPPSSETDTDEMALETRSRPGKISGTVGYMSPEQAGGANVDARSDVFSLGVVLYEMVTGRRAFAEDSLAATLAAVMREQPKAPSAVVPDVPRDLERVILRCLRKEVGRRYQSMADLKLELEQIKEDSDSQQLAGAAPAPRRRRYIIVAALAAVLLLSAGAWLGLRTRAPGLPPPQVVPLTTLRGSEWEPTFSPDGDQVAFKWEGGKEAGRSSIYVTMVGSTEVRQLTSDPATDDGNPSWSPDGRQIAFIRTPHGSSNTLGHEHASHIHLVSPLGGADRKLSGFGANWGQISWSVDSRWLVAAHTRSADRDDPATPGIYLVPVSGGGPRLLTQARSGGEDAIPAVSPDGRRLAYASCASSFLEGGCDVHLVELDGDLRPVGPPRRLTQQAVSIPSLAWTHDGGSIIYCANEGPYLFHLWRVGLRGDRPPERVELAGSRAWNVATARTRDRLVFVETLRDVDIHRFRGQQPSAVLVASSSFEGHPQFSPDGRRLAFASTRSGDRMEIWLAAADGSGPLQLTRGPGRLQSSPSWSPDGRWISFDSLGEDGLLNIWMVDAEGGAPNRLTRESGSVPRWSRDGRWVYFYSERYDGGQVWRVPSAGGAEERLTKGGAGRGAIESFDGRTLFFKRGSGDAPLVARQLASGAEGTVIPCVRAWPATFDIAAGGIYYLDCRPGEPARPALHRLDLATGRDQVLGTPENWERWSDGTIAVSPDGRTILYPKAVREGSDLMLIENFR